MKHATHGSRLWHVNEGRAHLESDLLQASVDVRQIGRGLHEVIFSGRMLGGIRFLELQIPGLSDPVPASGVSETYVRGADLVATYATTHEGQFRPQVYWSYRRISTSAGIELTLSMQTELLDSDPTLTTTTELPAGQLLQASATEPIRFTEPVVQQDPSSCAAQQQDASLLLYRFPDCPVTYIEMVYPSDLGCYWLSEHPTERGGWRCGSRLIEERLEKGVIRRARIASWFLPREHDESTAIALFQDFLHAPPPLTT